MVGNSGSVARRKTALIVEGGAMRGAWAAGVLAYLEEHGRRQYDLVYGASSGACSAAYFVADITVILTHNPAFRFNPIPHWVGKLAYPEFPEVARVWTARQNVNYNAALELMKQPPKGIRIRVFRPLRALPVGSFTVEPKLIAAALALGHDEALQEMEMMDAKPPEGEALN